MVQRIRSGLVGQAPTVFSQARIQRAGQQAGAAIQQAAAALDLVDRKIEAKLEREAGLFARVEAARIDREVSADLVEVGTGMTETGAGFSDAAMGKVKARQAEALARAGDDRFKVKRLNEMFAVDDEQRLQSFQKIERQMGEQYRLTQHEVALDDDRQALSRLKYSAPAAPGSVGGFRASLAETESSGNYNADRTNKDGRRFVGKYQFGEDRLAEYNRATGSKLTLDTFKASPALQEEVMDWHVGDIDRRIDAAGYDRLIGKTVDGVVMTRDGMRAAAHLGGFGGLQKFIGTDGKTDRKDELGTTLSKYMQLHADTDEMGVPIHHGPVEDFTKSPEYIAAKADRYAEIDDMDATAAQKAKMKRMVDEKLSGAALAGMVEQNPAMALALLRSGALDGVTSSDQTIRLQGALSGYQKREAERQAERERLSLERRVATAAKAQRKEFVNGADAAADDWLAWVGNGREGEQPALSAEQVAALPRERRQQIEAAPAIADAVDAVSVAGLDEMPALLESLKPSGEGYDAERQAFEAAEKVAVERVETLVAQSSIDASLALGMRPNMNDGNVEKEMGRRFAAVMAGGGGFKAAQEFVRANGVVPDGFADIVGQAMGGDNDEQRQAAINAIGLIHADDPRILAGENSDAIDQALAASIYISRGLTPEKALDLSAELAAPVDPQRAKARRVLWRESDLGEKAVEALSDAIEGREGVPATQSSLDLYSDLMRDAFVASGDVGVATELAKKAFFARNGITGVGGEEKYQVDAPEAVYGVWGGDRDTAWITAQAMDFIAAEFDGEISGVKLQPIGGSAFNGRSSYHVIALVDGVSQMAVNPFVPSPDDERAAFEADGEKSTTYHRSSGRLAALYEKRRAIRMDFRKKYRGKIVPEMREVIDAIELEIEAAERDASEAWVKQDATAIKFKKILDRSAFERLGSPDDR